jgi:hypothetical protein
MRALWMTGVLLLVGGLANATPIEYDFVQTSRSVPGFDVASTIFINGDFDDLPTLRCEVFAGSFPGCNNPLDFGNLVGFSIALPGQPSVSSGATVTLAQFIVPNPAVPLPLRWSISPTAISFNNGQFDFGIGLGFGPVGVTFNTDPNPQFLFACGTTGACSGTGTWVAAQTAIPEPSTIALVTLGLFGVFRHRRRPVGPRR